MLSDVTLDVSSVVSSVLPLVTMVLDSSPVVGLSTSVLYSSLVRPVTDEVDKGSVLDSIPEVPSVNEDVSLSSVLLVLPVVVLASSVDKKVLSSV